MRKKFDLFSKQFEEDKSNVISVNSVDAISADNYRHQAGYSAKEHLKPFPTILHGSAFVTYTTTLDLPSVQAYMDDYYGIHDPHHFPAKLLESRHVPELPLRWRHGYLVWVQANTRRTT